MKTISRLESAEVVIAFLATLVPMVAIGVRGPTLLDQVALTFYVFCLAWRADQGPVYAVPVPRYRSGGPIRFVGHLLLEAPPSGGIRSAQKLRIARYGQGPHKAASRVTVRTWDAW